MVFVGQENAIQVPGIGPDRAGGPLCCLEVGPAGWTASLLRRLGRLPPVLAPSGEGVLLEQSV